MPDKMEPASPYGDFVLPFDIANAGVRGRMVRLDASSARALGAHALPEPAARVAGEAVALGALLGTALKLDGRLTVQTKGDGPLDLITADYYGADENRARGVRGYARLDTARFEALGGQARVRAGALTDNGHPIVDVQGLRITDPLAMEAEVSQWPGVVTVGIFARHRARICLLGTQAGVQELVF